MAQSYRLCKRLPEEAISGKRFFRGAQTVWSRNYTDEESVKGKDVPDVVQSLDDNLRRGLTQVVAGLDQYFSANRANR